MCGIYGFTSKIENSQEILSKLGQTQIHRGPNGEGHFIDDFISMGMRRLSILDIANGNQPFFSADKNIVVICNGEIYNYRELKKELSFKGYKFYTSNDVETLPMLYQEYGEKFVEKLNGMFAIALYDQQKKKLFLYRDRLGEKPLYYAKHQNEIIFSSELKSILALNLVSKEINYDALSTYLDIMYIPKPMTPFKHIHKLPSASYLVWENNKIRIEKYWATSLADVQVKTEKQYIDELTELLDESAKMRLLSDVPVGSFLSGGVDSSFVTALAAKNTNQSFSTFHMHWKDVQGKIDESVYAEQVADLYKTKKHSFDVNELDLINLIPKLIYYMEEPFGDAAFIPTYFLSNFSSQFVTVMLSGAGGDELFGGYHHHKNHNIFKSIGGKLLYNKAPAFSYFDIWKTMFEGRWKKLFNWYKPNTFKAEFEEKFIKYKDKDRLNAIMLNDIEYYLQDNILFLTDKMAMATSIESRVPLLDHRLIEMSLQIPSSLKIKNGEQKYIFKKVAEQFLPKEVLYRKKEGFGFPIWKMINEHKEFYFNILLKNGFLVNNGLVEPKELQKLFLKAEFSKDESWYYWLILVLEIWCQLYLGDKKYTEIFKI